MIKAIIFVPSKFSFPVDQPIFLEVDRSIADDQEIYTGYPETDFPEKPGVYSCEIEVVDCDGGLYLYNFEPFDYQSA